MLMRCFLAVVVVVFVAAINNFEMSSAQQQVCKFGAIDDCSNAGFCFGGQCLCRAGRKGKKCEEKGDDQDYTELARCQKRCSHGRCDSTGKKCTCLAGYGGNDCDKPSCANCEEGHCLQPNYCDKCKGGFTAPTCGGSGSSGTGSGSNNANCASFCINGQCQSDNTCKCFDGYSGYDCSKRGAAPAPPAPAPGTGPVPSPLSPASCKPACKNGNCVSGVCQCVSAYNGSPACDTKSVVDSGSSSSVQKCKVNTECTAANTECQRQSLQCESGMCVCKSGYVRNNDRCVRLARLGDACSSSDAVCVENTQCSSVSGKCECILGHKQGPNGGCVANSQKSSNLQQCSSDGDCYYGLTCNSATGKCGCSNGLVADGSYNCKARVQGDSCQDSSDCNSVPYSTCAGGRCVCMDGYAIKSYMDENGQTKSTCASTRGVTRYNLACDTSSGTVCDSQLACITCPGTTQAKCLYTGTNMPPIGVGNLTYTTPKYNIYSSAPSAWSQHGNSLAILQVVLINAVILIASSSLF